MTALDVEGGARQLRRRFSQWKFGSQWAEALDEAIATERVATVERIRAQLPTQAAGPEWRFIRRILDEEAARG